MSKNIILSAGSYLPKKVLTNDEIALTVDTSNEWIKQRTGITQRHIAGNGELTSDLAVKAAENALTNAGILAAEINLIIVATTTPDNAFPSCATIVQNKLKCNNAFAFDIQAACSGFIYAVATADSLMKSDNKIKYALVIGAEIMSKLIDWQDRSTCILFGDGAGAIVMKSTSYHHKEVKGILSSHMYSDGNVDILYATKKIYMNGREVFRHAIDKLTTMVEEVLSDNCLKISDISWLIPHQANIRIIESVTKKLEFPTAKIINTIDKHANTSAASIPLALDDSIQKSKIKPGDIILLVAIGAGLTWGSILLRY
ncbi:3-oxoacyl-ACP synthase [Wolbachia pipientis]|uniref:Beta-ketoacyl-[acyl-carrier-protein] synthase III n=1 Tax=Wolbachia pipientis TaxID=955 RepID=A0A1E7QK17_WOLPI|nr:beta-ketoacyl-ACP synthase III [Wolbachia pipientis]OEY86564.1 3-oxoacyl-ACP synthase [Wolbachia pipientis]